MPQFVLLLPSAEGKRPGGNPLAPDVFDYRSSNTFNYFSELNPERRALIRAFQAQLEAAAAEPGGLERLLGLTGAPLDEAVEANRSVFDAPLMAAIERYGPGVMYRAMEFERLPTGAQRRLLEHGVILSGMFGLLRPDDLIPNYRLRMDAAVEGVGRVARYWRPALSAVLNPLLRERVVWNLLPSGHEEAWEDDASYERMYRLRFFREEGGALKPVSHGVKELRGALVHFVVQTLAETAEALLEWEAPGGFELDLPASELGDRGGTLVLVQRPGWEARREARREAGAEPLPRRPVAEDEEEA